MTAIRIDRIDDPRVAAFRDLRAARALRREGVFIAEGEWLVRRLISSRYQIRSILCGERAVERVSGDVPGGCEVYTMTEACLSQLVGFAFHRGMLACAQRPARPLALDAVLSQGKTTLTIVACPALADPVNLGRIVRLSAGLGVDAMLISTGCADELSRQALRVSMGSVFTLPIVRTPDFEQQLGRLREDYGCTLTATTLDDRAIELRDYRRPTRVVLLFGAEDFGLPASTLGQCDDLVTIRMPSHVDSFNVADAAAMFLYEFSYAQKPK